ncbi:MAG: hypothetical protein ACKOCI_07855 [Cyanobium sp.]
MLRYHPCRLALLTMILCLIDSLVFHLLLVEPHRVQELLRQIQHRVAAAVPYLPVWLVAPRAWARPPLAAPRFDGNGRLLLQELERQP